MTTTMLPLIVQLGPYPLLGIMAALLIVAVLTGLFYFGRNPAFDLKPLDSADS